MSLFLNIELALTKNEKEKRAKIRETLNNPFTLTEHKIVQKEEPENEEIIEKKTKSSLLGTLFDHSKTENPVRNICILFIRPFNIFFVLHI